MNQSEIQNGVLVMERQDTRIDAAAALRINVIGMARQGEA
jgi:hypothetical protein